MIGGLEAPRPPLPGKQPLSPGTVLRFDNRGNLIQVVPGTSPAGLAVEERGSWWCAEPVPGANEWLNYNDPASVQRFEERRLQAAIKCNS